jgi:vitamin-K-epoxide reductase (warfarin-sensitive)
MDQIQIFGILGFMVSVYALYVEYKKHSSPDYEALCDINEHMSCSKVLTSDYSHLFGQTFQLSENHPLNFSNATIGIGFYLALIFYPLYPFTLLPLRKLLLFVASLTGLATSGYLAFVLYSVLNDFCMVCMTTYVINVGVFMISLREMIGIDLKSASEDDKKRR